MVGRYSEERIKAAVLNPEDLEMLEDSHEFVEQLGQLAPLPLSDLELRALESEERPSPQGAIEDPAKIKALLGL